VDELEIEKNGDLELAVRESPLYTVAKFEARCPNSSRRDFAHPASARAISHGGSTGTRHSRVLQRRKWLGRNDRFERFSRAGPDSVLRTN
jgi:hypothetical protein